MQVLDPLLRALGSVVRANHMNPLVTLGAKLSHRYLGCYWNEMYYYMPRNGELLLLRTLASHWKKEPAVTIFDVGANFGDYAKLARQGLSNSIVHCFEVVPRTREILTANLAGLENVIISDCGLSSKETHIDVVYNASDPTGSRAVSRQSGEIQEVISCKVETGDAYLTRNRISSVGLLKIDTEGYEMAVLGGFGNTLRGSGIRVIQFEYGTTWIEPGHFLHEAYTLLEPSGFRIGRLYPDGVFFKPYNRLEDDHFRMGNYVAVHETCGPIIEALNLNPRSRKAKLFPVG